MNSDTNAREVESLGVDMQERRGALVMGTPSSMAKGTTSVESACGAEKAAVA